MIDFRKRRAAVPLLAAVALFAAASAPLGAAAAAPREHRCPVAR